MLERIKKAFSKPKTPEFKGVNYTELSKEELERVKRAVHSLDDLTEDLLKQNEKLLESAKAV